MIHVTLDEITLNAIKAALDERVRRLTDDIARYQRGLRISGVAYPGDVEDTQRALVWSNDALLQTFAAREIVGDAEVVPEQADDASWAAV